MINVFFAYCSCLLPLLVVLHSLRYSRNRSIPQAFVAGGSQAIANRRARFNDLQPYSRQEILC